VPTELDISRRLLGIDARRGVARALRFPGTNMRTFLSLTIAFGCGLSVVVACSGKAVESTSASAGSGGSGESSGAGGSVALGGSGGTAGGASAGAAGKAPNGGTGGVVNHEPVNHRATAAACDHVRATTEPNAPDIDAGYVACHSHADCTAGEDGRCVGNGHDGWSCTYDVCFTDADCPTGGDGPQLCACEGGDRSDNNVCLPGNCRVDGDCGAAGYCSPSLGSCGNFVNFVGYFCHTKDDECSDDRDCGTGFVGGAYCAFMPSIGHWQCSTAQCVG
jgi:hypothetical protein